MQQNLVVMNNGRATTTSLMVAEVFGKRHAHVLRDIREIQAKTPLEFSISNFGPGEYKDSDGVMQPLFNVTRDGVVFLIMGYTGEKATEFKIKYIEAFNAMERSLAKGDPALESKVNYALKRIADLEARASVDWIERVADLEARVDDALGHGARPKGGTPSTKKPPGVRHLFLTPPYVRNRDPNVRVSIPEGLAERMERELAAPAKPQKRLA